MSTLTVGIRELKNRLSEFIRRVRGGDEVLVTDRGVVVAELRQPGLVSAATPYPELDRLAREGGARIGPPNAPELYPQCEPALEPGAVRSLLEAERGER